MAEKIILQLEIDGVQRNIKGVQDLKKALKDSKDELLKFEAGTVGFAKAQKNVSALKDKLDGLGDSARIQGTGVERLRQSFSLLTESAASFDGDKLKTAFTGIGQAMSAIPIFLLVEGFSWLVQNMDKVVALFDSSARSAAKLKQEMDLLNATTNTAILLSQRQIDKLIEQQAPMDLIIKKIKELNGLKTTSVTNEISLLAKEIAKTEQEISEASKQASYGGALSYLFYSNKKGELESNLANMKVKMTELKNSIISTNIETESKIDSIEDKAKKEREQKEKEAADKAKEASEKHVSDMQDFLARKAAAEEEQRIANDTGDYARQQAANANLIALAEEFKKKNEDFDKSETQTRKDEDERFHTHLQESRDRKLKADEEAEAERLKLVEKGEAAAMEARKAGAQGAIDITNLIFEHQIKAAEGNQKKQLALQKKQFEANKLYNVAQSVIEGLRFVQGISASTAILGPLVQIPATIAAGISAAAVTAKIAMAKFEGGTPTDISSSASSPVAAPSTNTIQTIQPSTRLDENGNPININFNPKLQIVESEMTQKQRAIEKIKQQSKIG
jgi:hypothetical protein